MQLPTRLLMALALMIIGSLEAREQLRQKKQASTKAHGKVHKNPTSRKATKASRKKKKAPKGKARAPKKKQKQRRPAPIIIPSVPTTVEIPSQEPIPTTRTPIQPEEALQDLIDQGLIVDESQPTVSVVPTTSTYIPVAPTPSRLAKIVAATKTIIKKSAEDPHSLLHFPSLLTHEFGHALAGKLFWGSPINIHLGQPYDDITYKGGGITIHGDAIPKGGWASVWPKSWLPGKLTHATMLLAGPLSGAASYYLTQLMLSQGALNLGNKVAIAAATAIIQLWANMGIYEELRYGLTPLHQPFDGDGYQLWKLLGVPYRYLNKINSFDSRKILSRIAFFLLSAKIALGLKKTPSPAI